MFSSENNGQLIAVIGDEDTCVGFLLGGIGEINEKRESNIYLVKQDTLSHQIEEAFRRFVKRKDICMILITQTIAERIRAAIDRHKLVIPAVLEIPSKDCPYDSSKDPILIRARNIATAELYESKV